MFSAKNELFTRPSGGYTIARSVRLRSSATAYLNQTLTNTPTSTQKCTISFWVKRGVLGSAQNIMGSYDGSSGGAASVGFLSNDTFSFAPGGTASSGMDTTRVFRDPSAWYHIVVACDSTLATAANRILIYVNGVTAVGSTPAVTQNGFIDLFRNGFAQYIGRTYTGSQYFDGYLAEFNGIDGQALTPSSFGAFNIYGVWQPAKYQGTYGTNGFYLNFKSFGTAAALGTDSSGNGNTWTVNNISVTAGATYDSMTDVPTLTSATVANYPTLSPLIGTASANYTLNDGNLKLASSAMTGHINATMAATSGKYYWECIVVSVSSNNDFSVGVDIYGTASLSASMGQSAGSYTLYSYAGNTFLQKRTNSSGTLTNTTAAVTNDIIMIAMDVDAGYVWWGKNGTWIDSGNPATGANPMYTGLTGTLIPGVNGGGGSTSTTTLSHNFGQQGFTYTPPSGFVALNTYNLSTPTIPNGAVYMAATTWTGNGSTQSIVNTVNGTAMQPDLVWYKSRSNSGYDHYWEDSVRGVLKWVGSSSTSAELTVANSLTSFNSNGFTLGSDAGGNQNTLTYVGWQWKANGAGVTNTSGTITSTVSANTTAGFSIVTYTGTGANATVGHGLGVTPSMIIVKSRSQTANWLVWHTSLPTPSTAYLLLNLTDASTNSPTTVWNSTLPTSSVFSLGTNTSVNNSASTYVAYVFAAVAGYSAFGSYTGNGSTDGPFVFLGFRPRFIMFKRTDTTGDWQMYDSSRDTYNVTSNTLYANGAFAEDSNTTNRALDLLSNGFKLRASASFLNASGGTYIYMAFAENPFKYSLAR